MLINWEEMLKIEYGTPLSELRFDISHTVDGYHKVGSNQYVWAAPCDGREVFFGFAWVASDGVAEWVFARESLADDDANASPPDCLLPVPGMFSYRSLVEYGKRVDPEHFDDVVLGPCRVSFSDFCYIFRKAMPSESDYPIGILVDRSGILKLRFGFCPH
jgi:hypothetical protein